MKEYIIAVRCSDGNGIWSFKTKKNRQSFIDCLKRGDPDVEYATTEADHSRSKNQKKLDKRLKKG